MPTLFSGPRKQQSREKFVVDGFVEPRALYIEEPEAGDEARESECVNGELRHGFVGASVGFVIQDMNGAIAHLKEIDMSGDPSVYFPFTPADVAAIYTRRRDGESGFWFRLHDGRIFDRIGRPAESDRALYETQTP